MHHTVIVWLSFVGIVLTDAEFSIQSTTLAPPNFGPLQYTGAPLAYHPFGNQPSQFYPVRGPYDYQTALARNSIRDPASFYPGGYQQDNNLRSIPVPVSFDPNSRFLPNPYQTRNNLYVNSFGNQLGFPGFSTPAPFLGNSPFDFALQSTPRPFRVAHTPDPYFSSTPFPFTTQAPPNSFTTQATPNSFSTPAPPTFNSPESLPVVINNSFKKPSITQLNNLIRSGIPSYSTTPIPPTTQTTSLRPIIVDNDYQSHLEANLNHLIRPDVTSYSSTPFPFPTQAPPAESLPVIINSGFKKHPKAKVSHLIRPDISKYLSTQSSGFDVTTQATPSTESLPVIVKSAYKKHPKAKVDPLIRPDLTTYSTTQSPQNNVDVSALPRYYPIPVAVQRTYNSQGQSQSSNAVQLNSNALNLAQSSTPVQFVPKSGIPATSAQLTSNSLNQAHPLLPVQLIPASQSQTQAPNPVTSNPPNQAQTRFPIQITSNYLNQAQPFIPQQYASNSQNIAQSPIPVQFLASNSLDQAQLSKQNEAPLKIQFLSPNSLDGQQYNSNSQNQAQLLISGQLASSQEQSFKPVQSLNSGQLVTNSVKQTQHSRPQEPFSSNLQNQEQSPLRTFSLVPPSTGSQILISNPNLLQKMFQILKKGDKTGSLLTSSAVFPKPDLDDSAEFLRDNSYAKAIAYITSLLRANSESEPLVYIGTTPAPELAKYLEILPPSTAVPRVNFEAGDTNFNY